MTPKAASYAALLHHANEAAGGSLSRIANESADLVRELEPDEYEDACRHLRTL